MAELRRLMIGAKLRKSGPPRVRLAIFFGDLPAFARLRKMVTSFQLPCSFPTDPVRVFLFTEVVNAIELRSRLLAGDAEYLYTFLNADLVFCSLMMALTKIVSQLQLLAAVNRAVHDEHYGQMRTKHLHSEIVYALAATQNVRLPAFWLTV